MKFCENCGTQLADNSLFCEECGLKQEVKENAFVQPETENVATQSVINNVVAQVDNMIPNLSEMCTPAKREIRGWFMALLLIICFPLVLVNLIAFLPEFLFWVAFIGVQLTVLAIMWKRCNWNLWVKIGVIAVYILANII